MNVKSVILSAFMSFRAKRRNLLPLFVIAGTLGNLFTASANPTAHKEATVVSGNARFTVLTPRLIRMEWSADGFFEDRATLAITNRELPVPEFSARKSGKGVVIKTNALTLSYKGGGKFTADNLQVKFSMKGPSARKGVKTVTWHPGDDPGGNLGGTHRTLDGFDGERFRDPEDPGILSRDGWAVVDESSRHLLVPVDSDWEYWGAERPEGERLDLYLFAYGHDYTAALADFTKIAGHIPLPPKYAFGYWWCRYWQYSDFELVDLAQHFRDFSIPIDVMVIDMDWHETWSAMNAEKNMNGKDLAGERLGWTGYTWKKELFPNPANLLSTLHDYGVKTSLNLHFQSGMQPFEEPYERFIKDYTSRTSDYDSTLAYVPFRMDQIEWADAYFNSVMHPFEKQGVDFWWMDWQQWKESRYVKGLSNTFWLNYTFFNDKVRQSRSLGKDAPRPMIYHRWGGLGSHRYQIGFSGDTYATWKVLGALPEFTSTASNVGYGYWGHDIGGHMQPRGVDFTDPELYTRWLQEGVFSPIYKTHSTKNQTMEKRFWAFPEHFDAMREAVRLRYDLSPYIYTAAREAYDTGVSICRPLYYAWPEAEEAYTNGQEFMFGPDILATVVDKPVDSVTGLATRKMWFPEGSSWYDVSTGALFKGGTEIELQYTIAENPWFVRYGAVIPLAGKKIGSLQEPSNELRLMVAPGFGGVCQVYEDDGTTQAYGSEYATTTVVNALIDGFRTVTVEPRKGSYKGMPATRKVSVIFEAVLPPEAVLVNGEPVPYSRFAEKDAAAGKTVWGYDGTSLAVTVYTGERSASEEMIVQFLPSQEDASAVYGKKGIIRRFMALTPEAKLELPKVPGGGQLTPGFLDIAQCGSYITEDPEHTLEYLKAVDAQRLDAEFTALGVPQDFHAKCTAQAGIKQ